MNGLEIQASTALVGLLTRRQRDVLDQLLDGKPNKTIAQHLGVSTRTVEAHRAKIMSRLSVSSFAQLVRLADPSRLEPDFLGAVAQSFPGTVGFWDNDLVCQFANGGYLEWFGKPAEAVVGMRMQDLLGPKLFAMNKPYIDGALAGQRQRFTRVLVRADGTPGLVLANYVPAATAVGDIYGFVVFVTDVTPPEVPSR
jgi:PAS domain S-box-containing protein